MAPSAWEIKVKEPLVVDTVLGDDFTSNRLRKVGASMFSVFTFSDAV